MYIWHRIMGRSVNIDQTKIKKLKIAKINDIWRCCYAHYGALCALCCLFLLNACTWNYTAQIVRQPFIDLGKRETHLVSRSADWRFDTKVQLAVAPFVSDAVFAHQLQSRTATLLQNKLLAQVGYHFPHTLAIYDNTLPKMLHHARTYAANVLIVPSIMRYEENLNDSYERKGGQYLYPHRDYGADEFELQLRVYDVVGGMLLDVVTIKSKSAKKTPDAGQVSDLFEPGIATYLQMVSS